MQPTHNAPAPEDPTPAPHRVCVRGPAALAAAIPYLVGHLEDGSAVLTVITQDNQLRLTAHRSLPGFPVGASPEIIGRWADDVGRLVARGLRSLELMPGENAAVVLYLPAALGEPPQWFASRVLPPRPSAGLPANLLDVLAVFHGRWRSLACSNQACCPVAGWSILDDPDALAVSAELIGAGLTAARPVSRTGTTAPPPDQVAPQLAALPYPHTIKARKRLLRQAWPIVTTPPLVLQPSQAATLIMAADRPGVRDALLTRLARRVQADPSRWPAQVDLWQAVLRAAPADWVPGPACMVAVCSWALGESDRTSQAIAQALEVEPDHRMATLLRRLVGRGIPATDWFSRMTLIREADCLRFDRIPSTSRGHIAGRAPRAAS